MRGGTFFWTIGVARMQISVLRKNLYSFAIINYKWHCTNR